MRPVTIVETDHETFSLQRELEGAPIVEKFYWSEITEITAFKHDLLTFDLICLRIRSDKNVIEIDEEDPNWVAWIAMAEKSLPGVKPWADWFAHVAFPAFETKEQVIFTKPLS